MSEGNVIVIDAGHGGKDPGAVGSSCIEKDINLAVAWGVLKQLVAQGYDAHLTRSTDRSVDLVSRTAFANVLGADLFVSIHCNSSAVPTANGAETWHFPTDKVGGEVASRIQSRLIGATGWKDRGVKTSRTYWVLRKTRMAAVLVECGFVSNQGEGAQLANPYTQQTIAGAIAGAIDEVMRGVK